MLSRITGSARFGLALSYAALTVTTGGALMVVVFLFLLRYVPRRGYYVNGGGHWAPGRTDLLEAFLPKAIGTLGVLIFLGVVVGWVLAGRMLLPLREIESAARLAAEGSLSHRIALTGPYNEFRRVADTFDMMLARIERTVGEQQRFAANASHELRTPLAITQNVIELARVNPDRDIHMVLAELGAMNARAISLTEGLLLLAKIERQPIEFQPVDLALVVEDAAETLTLMNSSGDVSIQLTTEPAWMTGAPVLLEQLVANLLRNAVVHNDGADPVVTVRTGVATNGCARITVENTGTQLSEEQVATFVEPFQRGSGRTRTTGSHQVGAGLGLAIVVSIARAHEAELTLRPRPGGGLVATVCFPGAVASGSQGLNVARQVDDWHLTSPDPRRRLPAG